MTKTQLLPFSQLYWVRQFYIWSRQHEALHIWKVLSKSTGSLGYGCCPVCSPHHAQPTRILLISSPATTCCSWTLARSVPCGLLLIINSHSLQKAPAVMILWDRGRNFDMLFSGQLFGLSESQASVSLSVIVHGIESKATFWDSAFLISS